MRPISSIIINTYERPESLSRCIEALSRQKGIDETEIIVIDDGSRGDYSAIDRNWKKKLNFRYLKIRHSGRAAARNRGVRAAEGNRILFIGDDIIVRPGWLAAHLERGEGNPNFAVIGPCRLEVHRWIGKKPSTAYLRFAEPVPFDEITNHENVGFLYFVSGNLSMDRVKFTELGGFDERFIHYGWEDIDLGLRFCDQGGRIIFEEKAKAIHAHPSMERADLFRREFETGITLFQFWEKWKDRNEQVRALIRPEWTAGPAWRRRLGDYLIRAIENFSPDSPALPKLYERLVYSYRVAGIEKGREMYGANAGANPEPMFNSTDASTHPAQSRPS